MKFTISKDVLLEGLQSIQSVATGKVTLPILSNVLFEATEKGLRLTSADLDVYIRKDIDAQIEKEGATTLPARRIFSIVKELPANEISMETDSKQVTTLCCGASIFKIFGMAKDDYPAFPTAKNARSFTLSQQELKDGLTKTSYAISADATRYVLNGILFSFKENKLNLAATDGRRLALWDTDVEFPVSQEKDVIIPTKAISEIERLLRDTGDVVISTEGNLVFFELNHTILATKQVDGTYPNYRQVIPGNAQERITLEREPFLKCIHRVSLLRSDTDRMATVNLHFSKNNLDVTTEIADVGTAKESMAIPYHGREFSISFNSDFLMAPLKVLSDDEVYLEIIDEKSPGVLKIKSPFLYVIMPLRGEAA